MKKIIIVNNNMKVGGVQKSLYNLLHTIQNEYDITLLLFSGRGEYTDQLPDSVKVVECKSLFRYLGVSQGECSKNKIDSLKRGVLAVISKLFGRKFAIRLMLMGQPMLKESYDCAIAYLHNGNPKSFYGGVQDFVLHRIRANRKIAFLHCDYRNCGANHKDNNRLIEKFDQIAACSDGCRLAFEEVLPHLKEKCITVRNCHRLEEIRAMAEDDPVVYDPHRYNLVMVSRLSHEKGIERALEAVACAVKRSIPLTLHIVGEGAMRASLEAKVRDLGMESTVRFYGEQSNPYRYIKNADLFLLTSYHEAAPMVIEEARALGVPVLTTRTTSSEDMVNKLQSGWVCENTQDALNQGVANVLSAPEDLRKMTDRLRKEMQSMNNTEAMRAFDTLIGS